MRSESAERVGVLEARALTRALDPGHRGLNQLIAASLSQPILEVERIRQMGRLAESPNSKTVIMGQSNGATR